MKKIAVAATFTAEPLEPVLSFWSKELDEPFAIEFAPYNQVFQQLLDRSSLISENRDGINIILIRFEDWQRFENISDDEKIERNISELIPAVKSLKTRSQVPLLICVCPASPAIAENTARQSLFARMERLLESELEDISVIYLLDVSELFDLYPVSDYYDPHGDELGHIPFTQTFFTALGTFIVRKIYALLNKPYKVIVLDCDNTLWKGVCAEDGIEGIGIDPPRIALQKFMIAQHAAGKLICLCSKNSEEDIVRVFEERQEMFLKREHIVSWRIDWQPKSENIKSLAEELGLGLDSFIFIDDNPVECAEVKAHTPEVTVFRLPEDAENIERFLKHNWAFDQIKITAEDQKRTELYKKNIERENFRKELPSLEDFLRGLELDIKILPALPGQLPRVSQLTLRTNQFNATSIRRSEDEIENLCKNKGLNCLVVKVSDRFGDYGLVGAMMFYIEADRLDVDTFLLSCRVLGRGVEHRMLARLGEIAQERGCNSVNLTYIETERNRPALDFVQSAGENFRKKVDEDFLFTFPAKFAADMIYEPSKKIHTAKTDHIEISEEKVETESDILNKIAMEMYDHEKIRKKIKSKESEDKDTTNMASRIEKALSEHPHIRDVTVRLRNDVTDHKQFIAYVFVDPEHASFFAGKQRYLMPENMAIAHSGKVETEIIYEEIFRDRIYAKQGIVLNDGDCIIDAGAHIGMFTLFVSRICNNASIYAFEPAPPTFELLKFNTKLYAPDAKIFNYGLSDREKKAPLTFFPKVAGTSSYYLEEMDIDMHRAILSRRVEHIDEKLKKAAIDEVINRGSEFQMIETSLRPLSDVIAEHKIEKVDLLKIDVEESELDVINGIKEDDWPKINQIVVEVYKSLLEPVSKLLKRKGYDLSIKQEGVIRDAEEFMLYARRMSEPTSFDEKRNRCALTPSSVLEPNLLSAKKIRKFITEKLGIVTSLDIMFLDNLARNSNGIVEYEKLPDNYDENIDFDRSYTAPATPTEKTLAEIWADVLDIERVGINDNFFTLGGHSMLGVILISRILESFYLELSLTAIFEYPTVAEMAKSIEEERIARLDPEELNCLLKELDALSDDEARRLLEAGDKEP